MCQNLLRNLGQRMTLFKGEIMISGSFLQNLMFEESQRLGMLQVPVEF